MKSHQGICEQQIIQLDNIIEKSRKYLEKAPEGTLRTNRCHNSIQYYWRKSDTDNHGKYIRRSDEDIAKLLAQKDYVLKVLPIAIDAKKKMEQYKNIQAFQKLRDVYVSLPDARKRLVEPFVLPDEEYVDKWLQKQLEDKKVTREKYEIEEGILTEKGELVRSKSEKIIADKLYMMGIPYVYECPLCLRGFGTIYPDFTVLNKRTREEYYWEHLGMMDIPEYAEKSIKKIEQYERNEIYQGQRLILSYETQHFTPNMRILEKKIQAYLL